MLLYPRWINDCWNYWWPYWMLESPKDRMALGDIEQMIRGGQIFTNEKEHKEDKD